MADNQIGSYYLATHSDLYEVQRENNFEFIVYDIDNILKAGAIDNPENRIANAQQTLRFSMVSSFVPSFSQEAIPIKRGNSTMKAAGVPTFGEGSISVNDFIGADTKSALLAWQALSYNVKTEKVGRMSDYKKRCELCEYTPDFTLVRTWVLEGCWVSAVTQTDYNMEQGGKKTISATIQYDRAYIDYDNTETA